MKSYRNVKGIVIYEKKSSYAIILEISGKNKFYSLFHNKTDIRKRGFYSHSHPTLQYETANRFFKAMVQSEEKKRNESN